ncbi:GH116 family glycosyl hydrolase [Flavitalea sp.]|nr:GH116 family glycosyl hydrolase [Flavitalea sp.]
MKNKSRRKFIKHLGLGGLAAGISPVTMLTPVEAKNLKEESVLNHHFESTAKHVYNDSYTGQYLNRIAFPVGGLGAGMFCVEGAGAISHMSIRNKPEVFNEPGLFGALYVKGSKNGAKILEGPVPDWKKFGQPNAGNGSSGAITGLPHFQQAIFKARFPFATISLNDPDLPVRVQIKGWSPFIPTDENNSSLPAGALEYSFTNAGTTPVELVFSYNAKNFLRVENGKSEIRKYKNGFILSEQGTKEKAFLKSDFAIFTDQDETVVDHSWFRGGWWDPLTMAWNKIKSGQSEAVDPVDSGAVGASLFVPFRLNAGAKKSIIVYFAWFVPESDQTHGKAGEKKDCDPESGCCSSPSDLGLDKYDKDFDAPFYKPWYSSAYKSVEEVGKYWTDHYGELRKNSTVFSDAFFSSTLPPEIMEAIASNLTILKSPTVLRQYDGRLWSFEGCSDNSGCCHGSCTHVWNYAQAIPYLFPALERSLRHTEFCESQSKEGHQNFRATLPIKPATHDFHPAADGQLGGIMKVHREWRISGDNEWLKKMYPMVKTSLDYCIRTWDPDEKGLIEEPHHNTYDIEFWGPDGMHSSFYLGALKAITDMGTHLGKDVSKYKVLFERGRKYMEEKLYDGEYFIQEIKFTGLKAKNPIEASAISMGGTYSDEAKKLLEKEGPKYQYGTGCLSDGILGAWIARMCGLPDPVDSKKILSHLKAVHKYNLKSDLSDHANPQRPSYALGDEGGLLLCSWPKGGKLSLPFVYSDEVWTGIEHQVAAHLMLMGNVKDGLEIVRISRNRYDGRIRNPFNEYECGHWYARALSSYGYLQCLTGVRFDAVTKTLYVDSKVGDFKSFISTETGFGTVSFIKGKVTVDVVYGRIPYDKVKVGA